MLFLEIKSTIDIVSVNELGGFYSMKILLELYVSFFKVGLLTFGGGYAMLPMLKKEVVDKHNWISEDEMMDIYAIGQCTPGIIAVNTATYIGCIKKGVLGGIAATLGEITPSLIIILSIASIIQNFMDYSIVLHAFSGIRIAVCALIAHTVLSMAQKSLKDKKSFFLCSIAILLLLFTNISIIVVIIGSGFIGVLLNRKGGASK